MHALQIKGRAAPWTAPLLSYVMPCFSKGRAAPWSPCARDVASPCGFCMLSMLQVWPGKTPGPPFSIKGELPQEVPWGLAGTPPSSSPRKFPLRVGGSFKVWPWETPGPPFSRGATPPSSSPRSSPRNLSPPGPPAVGLRFCQGACRLLGTLLSCVGSALPGGVPPPGPPAGCVRGPLGSPAHSRSAQSSKVREKRDTQTHRQTL